MKKINQAPLILYFDISCSAVALPLWGLSKSAGPSKKGGGGLDVQYFVKINHLFFCGMSCLFFLGHNVTGVSDNTHP